MDQDLAELYQQAQSVTDKLRALEIQEHRNLAMVQAQGFVSFIDEQAAKADLAKGLLYNYMKPSTATTQTGMEADALKDATYLMAAARVLWPFYREFVYGTPTEAGNQSTQV